MHRFLLLPRSDQLLLSNLSCQYYPLLPSLRLDPLNLSPHFPPLDRLNLSIQLHLSFRLFRLDLLYHLALGVHCSPLHLLHHSSQSPHCYPLHL